MRDLASHVNPKRCIAPAAATSDNTPWVGQIIDRQGYDSLTYLIATGVEADADVTFAVLLEEGNQANLSDAATVNDIDTVGTQALAAFDFSGDNVTRKLGYVGTCRYTRLTITPANNTGSAFVSVIALLGRADFEATPNPPA